jgi:hypothetical protein
MTLWVRFIVDAEEEEEEEEEEDEEEEAKEEVEEIQRGSSACSQRPPCRRRARKASPMGDMQKQMCSMLRHRCVKKLHSSSGVSRPSLAPSARTISSTAR